MKKIALMAGAVFIIFGAIFYYFTNTNDETYTKSPTEPAEETIPGTPTTPTNVISSSSTQTEDTVTARGTESVIGTSVSGNDIIAYHFGSGERELLFIGGIHGGYSWNTALLNFELVNWLDANENKIPDGVMVTVIPVLNPDGLKAITGKNGSFTANEVKATEAEKVAARFNENDVDLNRNFDCEWQPIGTWQNKEVNGGKTAFSEPETAALKAYVESYRPTAVIAWYSAAGGVYASNCKNGVSSETTTLTNLYAKAAGYTAHETFNYYEITGDMVNWFAKQQIPAISVLLTDHTSTELNKNIAGVEAILNHYAE
jgi:hypothetical protein